MYEGGGVWTGVEAVPMVCLALAILAAGASAFRASMWISVAAAVAQLRLGVAGPAMLTLGAATLCWGCMVIEADDPTGEPDEDDGEGLGRDRRPPSDGRGR
jgi:hypothetical protein